MGKFRFTKHHSITVPEWLDRHLQDREPKIPYSALATVAFGEAIRDELDEETWTRVCQLRRRTKQELELASKKRKN